MKPDKIFLAFVPLFLCACSSEFDYSFEPADRLELSSVRISFPAENPVLQTISVEAGSEWTVAVPDSVSAWLSVNTSPDGFSALAQTNPDIYERAGTLVVTAGNASAEVKVTQNPLGVYFSVEPSSELSFEEVSSKQTVSVISNIPWLAKTPDWITVSTFQEVTTANGRLTVSASGRKPGFQESLKERSGQVDFFHDDLRIGRIFLKQAPIVPEIIVSTDSVIVDSGAFTEELYISANWPWSCSMDSSDSLWLHVTLPKPDSIGTNGTLKYYPVGKDLKVVVSAEETMPSRTGHISFNINGKETEVVVLQKGAPAILSIDRTSFEASADGESIQFNVTSNIIWSAVPDVDWIELDKSVGYAGTTAVTATIKKSDMIERSGAIIVTAGDKTASVSITQRGGALAFHILGTKAGDYIKGFKWQSSKSNAANLGVLNGYWYENADMKFEFYARGLCLINTSSGIRMTTNQNGSPTTNQIRNEKLAYIKFPAIEGYRLTKVTVAQRQATGSSEFPAFVSSNLGTSNADAFENYAVTGLIEIGKCASTTSPKNVDFILSAPKENFGYYLMLVDETGEEYQFHDLWFYYESVE